MSCPPALSNQTQSRANTVISLLFINRFGQGWARLNCAAPLDAFLGSGGLGTPRDPKGPQGGPRGDPKGPSHGKSVFLSRFGREWARWNRAGPLGAFLGVWWFGDPKGPLGIPSL